MQKTKTSPPPPQMNPLNSLPLELSLKVLLPKAYKHPVIFSLLINSAKRASVYVKDTTLNAESECKQCTQLMPKEQDSTP